MAQGTLLLFDELSKSIGDGRIDLDGDTFKIAFITQGVGDSPALLKTAPIPCWGAGGTTNLNTLEVAAGGGYTAEGETLIVAANSPTTGLTWSQTAGVATLDADDVTWTSSGSGDPATIKSAIIYSDTATNKDCIAFIDMTSDGSTAISLLAGDVTVTFGASGILTVTNP